MSDYKKLKVWEDAHKFTIDIYKITKGFPEDEKYGLEDLCLQSQLT